MGFLNKVFKKSFDIIPEQTFKHNVYETEISQYSSLPRFYYIEGKRYDIDSPESVSEIPICKTEFKINGELWGIDTILREHVNRYYSQIPEPLKAACYPKISDIEWSGLKVESSAEKTAVQKQAMERVEKEEKLLSISLKDMKQFDLKFDLQTPFYNNQMCIIPINKTDKIQVKKDLSSLNKYVFQACSVANIDRKLELPLDELIYNPQILDYGTPSERTEYYTFFQCEPYTKTGKLSKYPLILHYATKNKNEFQPSKNYFGCIYYMKDGSIGKCLLIFWNYSKCHTIELFRNGATLDLKKVEENQCGIKSTLYKA